MSQAGRVVQGKRDVGLRGPLAVVHLGLQPHVALVAVAVGRLDAARDARVVAVVVGRVDGAEAALLEREVDHQVRLVVIHPCGRKRQRYIRREHAGLRVACPSCGALGERNEVPCATRWCGGGPRGGQRVEANLTGRASRAKQHPRHLDAVAQRGRRVAAAA
eukprot:707581-Prymnesium_polylepis.1